MVYGSKLPRSIGSITSVLQIRKGIEGSSARAYSSPGRQEKAILFKAKEVPSTVGLLGLLGLLPWTGDWKHSLSLRKATLAFRSG